MLPGKHGKPHPLQPFGAALRLPVLRGVNPVDSHPLQIPHPLGEPRRPGHILGSGLQPFRQKLRHIMADGFAARSAVEQRHRLPGAQQQSRPLGAKKSFVPRHGDEFRPQLPQPDWQRPGGLGRIQNEGHRRLPAELRQLLHRQDIAEDIGHMGKHRRLRAPAQRPAEAFQRILPVKELSSRHLHLRSPSIQRAHHRVVLKTGHHHPPPGANHAGDGDVQPMGAVHGQHHLLRAAVEQRPRRLPAVVDPLRRLFRRPVAAPAGVGAALHGLVHRPENSRRLSEGGCAVIQVDHSPISSRVPSPFCR